MSRGSSRSRRLAEANVTVVTPEIPELSQFEITPLPPPAVSILVYLRFAPAVNDVMTVRTATLREQLDYLRRHHHPVIPLRALVRSMAEQAPRSGVVVITVDDGHASVFTEMLPIVTEYQIPVTLFIYPSAISNASYAMTWAQLERLRRTGLFDIESHTYWHPNFTAERRRLSPGDFRLFAARQLSGAQFARFQ